MKLGLCPRFRYSVQLISRFAWALEFREVDPLACLLVPSHSVKLILSLACALAFREVDPVALLVPSHFVKLCFVVCFFA